MSSLNDEINLFSLDGLVSFLYEFAIVAVISITIGLVLCWFSFFVVGSPAAHDLCQKETPGDRRNMSYVNFRIFQLLFDRIRALFGTDQSFLFRGSFH